MIDADRPHDDGDATSIDRHRRWRWFDGPMRFVAIAGLLAGLLVVFLVPPWAGGADESVHFARSLEIAHGRVRPVKDETGLYVSHIPAIYRELQTKVALENFDHWSTPSILDSLDGRSPSWDRTEPFLTGTTMSSTIAGYLPSAIAMIVPNHFGWSAVWVLWSGRLADLFVYLVMVVAAVGIARSFRWTIAVCALVPLGVALAGSVNPDGPTIAAVLLVVAAWTRVWELDRTGDVIDRATIASVAIAGVAVAVAKPPYFLVLAAIVVSAFLRRRNRTALVSGALAIAAVLVGAILSIVAAGDQSGASIDTMIGPIALQPDVQRERLLADPLGFVGRATADWFTNLANSASVWFRNFGFQHTSLPMAVVWLLIVVLVLTVMIGDAAAFRRLRRWDRAGFALTAPILLLLLYVSRYLYADDSVDGHHMGIQMPRYTFALLVVLVVAYAPRFVLSVIDRVVGRAGIADVGSSLMMRRAVPISASVCLAVPMIAAIARFG